MTITFLCEHCHKEVSAPDSAGGKRGKCPFCGQTSFIPTPVADDELPDLAPVDEEEERRRREHLERLRQQEHDLIAETGGDAGPPLEQRDDLTSEDLHHLVVNYCLDLFGGKLTRAQTHADKLRELGPVGRQAVKDFQSGTATEEALGALPQPLLMGFLNQLSEELG